MYYVYVIENVDRGKIYIGQTENLEKRLQRHNSQLPNKKTSFTSKNSGAWQIIHQEEFSNRSISKLREKELKSSRGRAFLRQFRVAQLVRSVG